ncbi:MAG: VOC family protein, partial [Acidothermaceae bacterium]
FEIGLDPQGHQKGLSGAVVYWHVDDIEQRFKTLLAAGAQEVQAITDFGGGQRLVASVRDVEGNVVGLLQSL